VGAEQQVHPVADVFHTIQSIAIRRAYELSRIWFLVPVNVTVIVFVTVSVTVTVILSVAVTATVIVTVTVNVPVKLKYQIDTS
jgi:hypothetical protein